MYLRIRTGSCVDFAHECFEVQYAKVQHECTLHTNVPYDECSWECSDGTSTQTVSLFILPMAGEFFLSLALEDVVSRHEFKWAHDQLTTVWLNASVNDIRESFMARLNGYMPPAAVVLAAFAAPAPASAAPAAVLPTSAARVAVGLARVYSPLWFRIADMFTAAENTPANANAAVEALGLLKGLLSVGPMTCRLDMEELAEVARRPTASQLGQRVVLSLLYIHLVMPVAGTTTGGRPCGLSVLPFPVEFVQAVLHAIVVGWMDHDVPRSALLKCLARMGAEKACICGPNPGSSIELVVGACRMLIWPGASAVCAAMDSLKAEEVVVDFFCMVCKWAKAQGAYPHDAGVEAKLRRMLGRLVLDRLGVDVVGGQVTDFRHAWGTSALKGKHLQERRKREFRFICSLVPWVFDCEEPILGSLLVEAGAFFRSSCWDLVVAQNVASLSTSDYYVTKALAQLCGFARKCVMCAKGYGLDHRAVVDVGRAWRMCILHVWHGGKFVSPVPVWHMAFARYETWCEDGMLFLCDRGREDMVAIVESFLGMHGHGRDGPVDVTRISNCTRTALPSMTEPFILDLITEVVPQWQRWSPLRNAWCMVVARCVLQRTAAAKAAMAAKAAECQRKKRARKEKQ
jgi:hypothetical protein